MFRLAFLGAVTLPRETAHILRWLVARYIIHYVNAGINLKASTHVFFIFFLFNHCLRTFFLFFSPSPLEATQIRGHKAGSSLPLPTAAAVRVCCRVVFT